MNTNFKVIGLTRLGIKPKFTAPEADALTTWPSELFLNPLGFVTSSQQCMLHSQAIAAALFIPYVSVHQRKINKYVKKFTH